MLILNPYKSERSKCLWMLTLLHLPGLLNPMFQIHAHLRSFLLGSFFLEEGPFSRKPKKLASTTFCSLTSDPCLNILPWLSYLGSTHSFLLFPFSFSFPPSLLFCTLFPYCCLVTKSCLPLCDPMDYAARPLCPWGFPGWNTEMGCHILSCIDRWVLYLWAGREALYSFTLAFFSLQSSCLCENALYICMVCLLPTSPVK